MDRAMVIARHTGGSWPDGRDHVRAELDRLARQVRKIKYAAMADLDGWVRVKDVLALIREAKR